ncbi:hypothetical protein K431DRAFT_285826 [Polychaeton citri CBS 116435]|uniref:Uncharacterized protein n=1 Tax=Polychaeton citri CBS 116435 TaxID=1314669 RepID=A0A9P4Q6C4_9PEZI|nr:hypothetical protein K431DRAFT_285826 [Polychaeton citri CBS 116435]
MYSIASDVWYLEQARGVWRHIRISGSVCGRDQVRFRDMDMEGGCYWTTRPGEEQINAVSSGLFAELSVRLALIDIDIRSDNRQQDGGGDVKSPQPTHPHAGGLLSRFKNAAFGGSNSGSRSSGHQQRPVTTTDCLEAARRSLGWILRCRYRNDDAVVLDGFLTQKDVCNDWTFTYTTGVAIGICALMYQALPDEDEYIMLACHMANKAMRRQGWIDQQTGVVAAEGEFGKGKHDPFENNDSIGFKSVLVRQLCTLYNVIRTVRAGAKHPLAKETADLIQTCIKVNFESQVHRNTNGIGQYGPWWPGPFESPTSHSQMAMLDVMAAIELVTRK